MRQIFMSYDHADEAFAAQLADDLTAHGANVWLDVRNARPGRHWTRSIEHALSVSNMMIVILSPEALVSHRVAAEWQSYMEAYRPVIPVLALPCDPPGPLRTRRPIDFTRERFYDRALHELTTRLIEYMTRIRRQQPVVWSSSDAGDYDDYDGYSHQSKPLDDPAANNKPRRLPVVDEDQNSLRRVVMSLRDKLLMR